MNAQIAEQLESMHRMLTKTREDVKGLRLEVSVLHQALSSGEDIPPPAEEKLTPPIEDEMDVLSAKNIKVGTLGEGLDDFMLLPTEVKDADGNPTGALNWKIDPESKCKQLDVC